MTATIIESERTQLKEERSYTPEEYLAFEEESEYKHEYRNGKIVAVTGGTTTHNQIAGNIFTNIKLELKGKKYLVFFSDVRLWIPRYNQFTYPDIMVISGQPTYHKGNTTITNPLFIIEVLSQSTQDYDRGTKFTYYRSIPELQEYILIDQYSLKVEQFSKKEEGQWLLQEYEGERDAIFLKSLKLELSMTDIYEQVQFDDFP